MLIESDILVAVIKERDHLKSAASSIMNQIHSGAIAGACASVAVIQEVVFLLLKEDRSAEILPTINSLFNIRNLEWVDLNKEILLNATALMEEYHLSPFDAYHAATAMSIDGKIVSSDHSYDRVKGIERTDPLSLV